MARRRGDLDAPAMGADDLVSDVEAEAEVAVSPRRRGRPLKRIEDVGGDLLGDRWSLVRDGRAHVGIPLTELDLDLRTPVGVLERVANDVAHGLAEQLGVPCPRDVPDFGK